MTRRRKSTLTRTQGESGQTTIFVALAMNFVLVPVLGLIVIGSQVFAEYRHMQSAADMAALTAAQQLPCDVTTSACNGSSTITSSDGPLAVACNIAQAHGFGGGWNGSSTCNSGTGMWGGSSSVSADVPPQTCSPYDFIDYGNDNYGSSGTPAGNANCKSSSTRPTSYSYVEVQTNETFGSVPLLNIPITLSTHAVARHGIGVPTDFAVAVLDPNDPGALTIGGTSNTIALGSIMSNSSIVVNGLPTSYACQGEWYTAANEGTSGLGNITSSNASDTTPSFAPSGCDSSSGGAATSDSPIRFSGNAPMIPDPYGGSSPPSSTTMPNCVPCESTAEVYVWTSGQNKSTGSWYLASSLPNGNNNTVYEFFPGIYPNGLTLQNGLAYFNPGVYTMEGDVDLNGASFCIYGAPACDYGQLTSQVNSNATCSNVSFWSGSTYVSPSQWYYYCSYWGMWDWRLADSTGSPLASEYLPPTFVQSNGTPSTVPLNGITFYMQSGAFSENGNAAMYLAAPDPCPGIPGDASFTAPSDDNAGSVPFGKDPLDLPSGDSDAYYVYPSGSRAKADGYTYSNDSVTGFSGSAPYIYPNTDFDQSCANGLYVWENEMPSSNTGQQLHFLIFADNSSTSITLNGGSLQGWLGILHTFPQNYAGYPGAPTSGCGSCSVSINGTGGGSSTGPPFVMGQVVGDNVSFGGNGSTQVYYRECRAQNEPCGNALGTSLVQ